jgi:acetyl-CoA C-acetyltransferase
MGSDSGAWFMDPSVGLPTYFMPQGVSADLIATKYGFSPRRRRRLCGREPEARAKAWEKGRFKKSIVPVKDENGLTILDHDEHMRPTTDMQSLARSKPSFEDARRDGRLRRGAHAALSRGREDQPRPSCRQLVGHRRWRGRVLLGSKEGRQGHGPEAARAHQAFASIGSEPAIMLTGPVDVTEKLLKRAKA